MKNKKIIIKEAIKKLSKQANRFKNIHDLYWFSNLSNPDDIYKIGLEVEGLNNFCYKCAKQILPKLKKISPNAIIDGGWGNQESDEPCFCAKCNCVLEVSLLTANGEIDHFVNNDINFRSPYVCWQVVNVLEIYEYVDSDKKKEIMKIVHKTM